MGAIYISWAVTTVVSLGAGWALGRRSKRERRLCGCGHPLAMHDPETKECCEEVWRRYQTDTHGFKLMPCNCRQYVGDTPPGRNR